MSPHVPSPTDLIPDAIAARRLRAGLEINPHGILGAHPAAGGTVLRAFHPDASGCDSLLLGGAAVAMTAGGGGLFAAFLPGAAPPLPYRLRFHFPGGGTWERDDPYRFLPTLGDLDLHLIGEGRHRRLWEALGSRPLIHDGVAGTAFSVWAPNARRVSVVGSFCRWDGRLLPMRALGASGVFELFLPGVGPGDLYKYEIVGPHGAAFLKADPLARAMEAPPRTASRVTASAHTWGDDAWMRERVGRDATRAPLAAYEVHLGSWARVPEEGNRSLGFREIAVRLAEHALALGCTHLELLPVSEHPFYGSWGYQISAYFAPTSRYGSPDDFRFLVDHCHQRGLGVILDWVPAHFPKDAFALRRFDGTALYEHDDPRRAEHPDWGTLVFNYGRHEVRNFLIANALYWLREFHVDALRVDAVASMLYLDYSRKEGEWLPNRYGGRENLDATQFLRQLNETVRTEAPGCFTIAEESTAWPGVTRPVAEGGLGFALKWNMGWMHDTLRYFQKDPVHRRFHHDELTFAMLYENTERFLMPLSHDEVVHGKGSLYQKMPGDPWQRLANLRLLLAYQYTRPGKKLVFMGTELATPSEWDHDRSLDWHLLDDPGRAGHFRFLAALGRLYRESPPLWRSDPDPGSFEWIDCADRDNSVVSYLRRDGEAHLLVVLNLTPAPRDVYRIGSPAASGYRLLLDSDAATFGGSGYGAHGAVTPEPTPLHGQPRSLTLRLPPLAAVVYRPDSG